MDIFKSPFLPNTDKYSFDISKYSKPFPTGGMSKAVASPVLSTQNINPVVAMTNKPSPTPVPTPSKAKTVKPQKTAEQKYQEDIKNQIENAYKAQVNFLSGQEASLQGQLPDYLASIARPFEAQQPLLEQQLAEQQAKGITQQEGLKQQQVQGLAQTRRSAEEAGIRNVQQFGGVGGSSAGQAAGELIAREALKQQGAIQQQTVQGIQNINDQLRAIQGEYNANVSKLALQKEQALSNARLEFQKQLDTIRKEKMTAGVTKANMTIQALGQFAATRQQIEKDAQTQSNNLAILREQAALNAQNLRLTQSLTPTTITNVPTSFKNFFQEGTSNQSSELAKVLTAGVAAGTIKPFGTNASGEQLFIDKDGMIADIKGNKYPQQL